MNRMVYCFLGFIFLFSSLFLSDTLAQQNRKVLTNISSPKFLEFAPAISGDGNTLVFQQMRKDRWYLYQSELLPNDTWSEPVALDNINDRFTKLSGGGPSLSYDGKILYFSAYEVVPEGVSSEDIFVCKKTDGVWSDPENMGKPINSFRYEGAPSISADGKTLYFMRENIDYPYDKDTKVHCFVLFKSFMDENGNWQEPVILPYPINFNCERSPKIMIDGKTLMFSSLRANGKGGFDIYQSQLQSNGTWSNPISLDYLNTSNNDQSPCLSSNGEIIYYYGDGDIYEVVIPKEKREFDKIILNGRVIDAVYKAGLSVDLEIVNHYTGQVIAKFDNTESDGKFTVALFKGMKYDFNIIQDNFFTYIFPLDFSEYRSQPHMDRDFELFSNLNLRLEVVDVKTQMTIPYDKRIIIRMDKTPREEIYLLKFMLENYWEASTFLDLNEVRRDPEFKKRIEVASFY